MNLTKTQIRPHLEPYYNLVWKVLENYLTKMDLGETVKESSLVFVSTRNSDKYFSSDFTKTSTRLVKN